MTPPPKEVQMVAEKSNKNNTFVSANMEATRKIKKELKSLKSIFLDIPEEHKELFNRLIERAAFMLVTLKEYEENIKENGVITTMAQGDYEIERENPAAKGYNTMVKNYQSIIRQLADLLPDKKAIAAEAAGAKLKTFLVKGKTS